MRALHSFLRARPASLRAGRKARRLRSVGALPLRSEGVREASRNPLGYPEPPSPHLEGDALPPGPRLAVVPDWSGPLVNTRERILWTSPENLWTATGRSVDRPEEIAERRN